MLYAGLDVHSKQSSLCILNAAGGTVNQIQLKGTRSNNARATSIERSAPRGRGPLLRPIMPQL
jgi:hypothetical protein